MRALSQQIFSAPLLRKRPFFKGFAQHGSGARTHELPRTRALRALFPRPANVAILGAKSRLSACSGSACARAGLPRRRRSSSTRAALAAL
jgi:hypothetical protein